MSEWQKYGFPDPCMISSYLPMEGLFKALVERGLAAGWKVSGTIAVPILINNTYYYNTDDVESCDDFDVFLKKICPSYLDEDGIPYTWESLVQKALKEGERLAEYSSPLAPKLSLRWAHQRYRMINLLRKIKLPITFHCMGVNSSIHDGQPTSVQEAYDTIVNSAEMVGMPFIIQAHAIYGPDHGWKEGSYCLNLAVTREIWLDTDALPDGVSPTDCRISFTAVNADPDTPAPHNLPFTEGTNTLPFDEQGLISLGDYPLLPATPTKDHETYMGFNIIGEECYYAKEPDFIFLDDI